MIPHALEAAVKPNEGQEELSSTEPRQSVSGLNKASSLRKIEKLIQPTCDQNVYINHKCICVQYVVLNIHIFTLEKTIAG